MTIVPPDLGDPRVDREAPGQQEARLHRVSYVTDFDGTVYKLSSGSPEDPDTTRARCGLVFIFAVYKGTARHNAGVTCGSRHHCVATALSF